MESIEALYKKCIENSETNLTFVTENKHEISDILSEASSLCKNAYGIYKISNKIKIVHALKGLAGDSDVESSIYALRNYVNSPDRSFYIATAFRKIILSNSKIAATIIGYMLGEISNKAREFTNEDIILFNALENMSDFDIRNFKDIMNENYFSDDIGTKYFDTLKFPAEKEKEFLDLLEFGEKYRLFSIKTISVTNGRTFYGEQYVPKMIDNVLVAYINKVKQILNYGE